MQVIMRNAAANALIILGGGQIAEYLLSAVMPVARSSGVQIYLTCVTAT
jgi:hypothetical protein